MNRYKENKGFDSNIWQNSFLLAEGDVFTKSNFGCTDSESINLKVMSINDLFQCQRKLSDWL